MGRHVCGDSGRRDRMKRRIKVAVGVTIGLGLMAVMGANGLIRASAEGRTYSDVSLIPYRRTGVILGCSRQLSHGRANLFFSFFVMSGHLPSILLTADPFPAARRRLLIRFLFHRLNSSTSMLA